MKTGVMNLLRTTISAALLLLCTCQAQAQAQVPVYSYKVIKSYPLNISSFTQGLQIHDGYLYEGTGRQGA